MRTPSTAASSVRSRHSKQCPIRIQAPALLVQDSTSAAFQALDHINPPILHRLDSYPKHCPISYLKTAEASSIILTTYLEICLICLAWTVLLIRDFWSFWTLRRINTCLKLYTRVLNPFSPP